MAWIRCPYGCYFELAALNWGVFKGFPDSHLTCDGCHRANPAKFYVEDAQGGAVSATSTANLKKVTGQLEKAESIKIRMMKLIGSSDQSRWKPVGIASLYASLCQMLITSELTSNFPTSRIFGILSSGSMKNTWAIDPGSTSLQTDYSQERNKGETALFGGLSASVSKDPTAAGRPIYIALSPGRLIQGAAPNYDRSYMVYRDELKLRCTFTATDSLQMLKQSDEIGPSDVCFYGNIADVLFRVTDRELAYLCSLVGGPQASCPNEFIEAQGWGTVNIATDISTVVISTNDLKKMVTDSSKHPMHVAPELVNLGATARQSAIDGMLANLKLFCAKNNIALVLLPLGPDTMNSRDKRT